MSIRQFSTWNRSSLLRSVCAISLLAFAAGCATTAKLASEIAPAPEPQAQGTCPQWFAELDAAIDRAGVRDAAAHRIAGFPYLRVDRFTASFREQARDGASVFDAWFERMQLLDAQARDFEIGNLPTKFLPLAKAGSRQAVAAMTHSCAAELARVDRASAARRLLVLARAQVPDSYSDWKREIGLYPIASIGFGRGVEAWHKQAVEMFHKSAAEPYSADVLRYAAAKPSEADRVAAIFARAQGDALGIPRFSEVDKELLLRAYAPAFAIETTGRYDRFGPLAWGHAAAPEVDTARPVAYSRLAFTRFHGAILTQVVYTIWFPERPADGATDLLAGRLDGVVFRVTLGSDGAPLVYDTMHPCGCYHMFFPTARMQPVPSPDSAIEWAFAPESLPPLAAAQRVVVRIQSRTHYVVDVRADDGAAGIAYGMADDDNLRALPNNDRTTRSAFGPDGIVPGTERGERYVFWPMGIDNSGAMRQWGNHATAFIGERHFDDADLIERRYSIVSAREPVAARSD